MPFASPPRQVRYRRPSSRESGPSRNSPSRRAAASRSSRSSLRAASASAASARPFQAAIALSSSSGFGRRSRRSNSRARSSGSRSPRTTNRPCSNGCSSSSGTPSSGAHVNVRPSTPSVSASCADANPPEGRRSSRSMYSSVSSATWRYRSLPVTSQPWR